MSRLTSTLRCTLIAAISILAPAASFAATFYGWDSDGNSANGITDGSGTWSVANADWFQNTSTDDVAWLAAPITTDDTAAFGGTGSAGGTITISGSFGAGGIVFNGTDSGVYTLQGTGTPTLTLGAGGITMNSGAGADVIGSTTAANNFTISISGNQSWTNNSTTNALTINSAVNEATAGSTLTIGGAGNTTFSSTAVISNGTGALSLSKSGGGTLTLGGANTFSGGVTVSQGTLVVNSSGALGATTNSVVLGDVNTGANPVVLKLGTGMTATANISSLSTSNFGTSETLIVDSGSALGANAAVLVMSTLNLAGSVPLTIQAANSGAHSTAQDLSYRIIGNGIAAGTTALTLDGTAKALRISFPNGSAANNFTGDVVIKGAVNTQNMTYNGQIAANQNLGFLNNNMTVSSGATWTLVWGGETVGALNGSGTITMNNQNALNNIGLTVGNTNINGSYSGGITGGFGLAKVGTGTEELSGSGVTYTGTTTVSNGTLRLTRTSAYGAWASNVAFATNGTPDLQLNDNASATDSWTFSKQITGGSTGAKIEKVGQGVVVLTPAASSSFVGDGTGALTVTAGKLYVNNANFTTPPAALVQGGATLGGNNGTVGAVTVADTGILEGGQAGTGVLTMSSLTFNNTASIVGIPSASTAPLKITGALTTGANANSISVVLNTVPANGTYHLIQYGSLAGTAGFNAFAFPSPTRSLTLQNDTTNNFINVVVNSGAYPIWTGANGAAWSGGMNWKLSTDSSTTDFLALDNVVFDDSALGTTIVNVGSDVNPASTVFNFGTTIANYTLQGSNAITAGTFTKSGTGTLTITNTNSFTGEADLNGGVTAISTMSNQGSNGPLGAGNLAFGGGTLEYSGGTATSTRNLIVNAGGGTIQIDSSAATLTMSGTFSGAGTLTLPGAGTFKIASAGTNAQNIALSAGTLQLDTAAGTQTDNGAISGTTGTIRKTSTGTLILGGAVANTFSGTYNNVQGITELSKTGGAFAISGNINFGAAGTSTGWGNAGVWVQGGNEEVAPTSILTWNSTMADAMDFSLDGHTQTVGGLVAALTSNSAFAIVEDGAPYKTATADGTLRINTATAQTYSFSGQIRDKNNSEAFKLNVVKQGAGMQVLTGSGITYTGTTTINGGTLRFNVPTLPSGNITLNGGVLELQSPSSMSRSLGAAAGQIQITGGTSGFSAMGSPLTVTLNGSSASTVQWGSSTFQPGALVLNETTATSSINFQNPIDLNGSLRTVNVNANTATLSGAVSDSTATNGALFKGGAGTLLLTNTNTYSGPTTVSAGKMYVNGSLNAASAVTVGSTATFGGTGSAGAVAVAGGGTIEGGQNGAGTLALTNLSFVANAAVNATPASGNYTPITLSGTLTASGGDNSVLVNIGGSIPNTDTYHLIQYTGTISPSTFGAFMVGTTPGGARTTYNLVNDTSNDYINLVVSTDSLIWSGGASTEWSTNTIASPKNWKLLSTNAGTDFQTNDVVLFDDGAGTSPQIVDVSVANVTPATVTFNNSNVAYTLQGSAGITGSTPLTMGGAGVLTITNSNSFTGPVNFNNGTISVASLAVGGTNSPLGAGTSLVFGGGTLEYSGSGDTTDRAITVNSGGGTIRVDNSAATVTLTGTLSGSGVLTKSGPGVLTLSSSTGSGYNGGLVISNGKLAIGSASAVGASTNITLGDANTGTNNVELSFGIVNNIGPTLGTITVSSAAGGTARIDGTKDTGVNASPTFNLVLNRSVTLGIDQYGGAPGDFSFTASGPGAGAGNDTLIIAAGSGQQVRTSAITTNVSTFAGNVHVISGTWQMQNTSYLANDAAHQNLCVPDTSSVTVDNGATWKITHGVETIDALNGGGTVQGVGGTAYLAGAPTLTLGGGNGSGSFSGTITNGGIAFSLAEIGTGTQTLSGTGINYTGATTVSNGTLNLMNTTAFASPTTVASTGTLAINSSLTASATVTLQDGTLRVNNTATFNGALTLSGTTGGTINVLGGGAILTLAGGLFGTNQTLAINNSGGGNAGVALTNAGGFSGSVNVVSTSTGSISLSTSGGQTALANATLRIDANTALALGVGDSTPFTFQVNSLNGAGGVGANNIVNQTLQLGGNGGSGNFTGTIIDGFGGSGTLAVTKVGSGTQILGGASTYSGGTTITGGTLRLTNPNGSATGTGRVTVGDSTNPATLAGSTVAGQGSIGGAVVVNSAATITGGSGASLTIGGGLTLNGGSLSTFALTAAGANNGTALVNIAGGGLTGPSSGTHTINLTGSVTLGTYDLFSFTGTAPALTSFTPNYMLGGGYIYSLAMTSNQLDLIVANPNSSAAWNFNGNDVYGNSAQWTPQAFPTGAGQSAVFGNGDGLSTPTTVNAPFVTVMIDNAYTLGSLVFNNTLGTSYTLGNDSVSGHGLTLDDSGSGATVSVSANVHQQIFSNLTLADNATFNIATNSSLLLSVGNIGESGGSRRLTKTGGGMLTIDTPSSYSGGTTVSNGTLTVTGTGGIGTGSLEVDGLTGNASVVNLQNSQAVTALSGSVSGGGSSRVSVTAGKTLTVNPATTATYAGALNLAAGNANPGTGGALSKAGSATEVLTGAVQLGNSSVLNVSGGSLRVNASGGAIGTGVTANVSGTGTLELAGAYSALGTTTAANRTAIVNNSSATAGVLVSSGNQQVGGIDGSGNVQVTPPTGQSDSLTADHITAGSLVIGGDATSSAVVTIAASNPDGTPMATSSGFALADSLAPSAPFASGSLGSSTLLAADDSSGNGLNLAGTTLSNLNLGGNTAAVPEPSTILLLLLGSLALLLPIAQRRASRSQALPGNALPARLRLDIAARSPRH